MALTEVNDPMYLAGDFSGIQRFVLRVKTAGKAQAKRLRARSFLLELLEHAALWHVQKRFEVSEKDILIRGGGGFLVRISSTTDTARIDGLVADLQHMLWDEFAGQIQLAMGWATTPLDARARLERQKRKPAASVLQRDGGWVVERWSQPPLDRPCEVCREFPGMEVIRDEDEEVVHCQSCLEARKIGQELTRRDWMRAGHGALRILDVPFELLNSEQPGAQRIGRWIPRKTESHDPMTFEELSQRSRGDPRLAVLKADVDDMGLRVGEVANIDPSHRLLHSFSRDLHTFFGDRIQEMTSNRWPLIYTLYAGGDDLLMIGPWNVVLDFVGEVMREFQAGPACDYGCLTFSAGIALTPYRVPIRHSVERAEELLESAKGRPGKNRCAALGGDWTWERHGEIIHHGKMIAESVSSNGVARGLLHRLLKLVEASEPGERELRAVRWSYQIARNVPRPRGEAVTVSEFRRWAQDVLGYLEGEEQRTSEAAVSLRYALLATRSKTGGHNA